MLVILAGAALLVASAAYLLDVRVNLSGSIPVGLYRFTKGPIRRGSIVLICLPRATSALARARGYVPRGACDDGSAPIGKTVAAIGGDTVVIGPDAIAVNGRRLRNSQVLRRDSHNRSLRAFPEGRYIVRPGELWLISTYSAASFDSRYFGPLAASRVVARIARIAEPNAQILQCDPPHGWSQLKAEAVRRRWRAGQGKL